jgi:hypothetical protein
MSNKIKIYYHIADLWGWQQLVNEKINLMKQVGLWHAASEIHLLMHYSQQAFESWASQFLSDNRVVLKYFENSARPLGECYSNRYIWYDCANTQENFYLLRFHTKGLYHRTLPHWPVAEKWNQYIDYFNIERWTDCVQALDDGYDTAGTNWWEPKHYSGNVWWAQSNYIRRLPLFPLPHLINFRKNLHFALSNRHDAEHWIGLADPKYKEFHHHEHYCVYDVNPPENYRSV